MNVRRHVLLGRPLDRFPDVWTHFVATPDSQCPGIRYGSRTSRSRHQVMDPCRMVAALLPANYCNIIM